MFFSAAERGQVGWMSKSKTALCVRSVIAPALLAMAIAAPALAEDHGAVESSFTPADFSQYAPLNARDMVERIPGFRLSDSRDQDESRGLGQATENVLINGQRISSKSASAADVLARIPADTVELIEVLEGASLDIPGLSGLVVNVIAKANGISGNWAWRGRAIDGQTPLLYGSTLSVAGQRGDLGWSVNFEIEPRGSSGTGTETVTDAGGALIESRHLIQNNRFPTRDASLSLRWTPPSGLIANLSADYDYGRRDQRERADRFPNTGAATLQHTLLIDQGATTEVSGDVEFDLLSGRLKLISVYSEKDSPFTNERDLFDPFGTSLEQNRFFQQTDETELILRGEYKWTALGGNWDGSFEAAENTLDSRARLLTSSGGGPLTLRDIGDTTVAVEESRSEGFVTYSRAFGDQVQLQLSLGTEISEIRSGGPQGQTRSFTRPKGGVTLSYRHDESTTINARIDREVGQLDFFDFVSQLDLNDGDNQVGNADIVPEQSWRTELEIERQFGAWGAGNVILFAEALEDIVDQVPIGTGEGPGNIDRGQRFGVEFEGTLNFDPIGLSGAQLIYSAGFRDSIIEDPLTGEDRSINREDQIEIELEFRHDIAGTQLAWGGDISPSLQADTFRVDSIRSDRDLPGNLSLFLEHKNLWGLTARAELFRPITNIDKESRRRFSPDRMGPLVEIERTRVEENPVLIVGLTGRF